MQSKGLLKTAIGILGVATALLSQTPDTIAIRAGHMFDPRSDQLLPNQVVLIQGDRIIEAGPASSVSIPSGAKVIDLSHATVLPGLIDGHVHLTDAAGGLQHQMLVAFHSATESLRAGFTTQVVMGSHGGGYADVELKKAIETGLVHGPRLITAGPVIEITSPASAVFPLEFKPFEPALIANGAEGMREAVRELAHYGVEHVKIMSTGRFFFKANGEMVNEALPDLEEAESRRRRGAQARYVGRHAYLWG
jgi:imidazolonepropionase-like amidohydrolase